MNGIEMRFLKARNECFMLTVCERKECQRVPFKIIFLSDGDEVNRR